MEADDGYGGYADSMEWMELLTPEPAASWMTTLLPPRHAIVANEEDLLYESQLRSVLLARRIRLPPPMRSASVFLDDLDYGSSDDGGDDNDDDAYGNGGFGAVPAAGEAIAALLETAASKSREKECAVCLEGFEESEKMRKMPCSHGFHEGCIFEWLRVSRVCPLCRFALPAETEM